MKTQDEIVEKIREREAEGFIFDFFPDVLVGKLDFEHAKEFLKEGATAEEWAACCDLDQTREEMVDEMAKYMKLAWDKANNERGLSANRSVQKMEAWCWLLGVDHEIDWDDYEPYGKPILRRVCQKFDLPIEG